MRPLDPKLLRYARTARWYLALTVALGILTAGLVVAQALLLARALGRAVEDGPALGDAAWTAVAPLVGWLALVVLLRVAATTVQERYAHRAATRATAELREAVVARSVLLGPRWLGDGRGPELVALATRGLDDLEPYFVRYLPQLVLAATVTPGTLLVVLGFDWVSALVLVVVLPLVPIFMWLVGRLTQGRSERGLATMQRLSSQVLDLLAGLPTLRGLGREHGPAQRVRALGDAHRRATMGTLRIAFLSGMVLELLSTLCVALVAVGIGLRLVEGHLDLVTGLTVLVLAPEVFAPLRAVGMQFHASTDGVAAAQAAFDVLDQPAPVRSGSVAAPDLRRARVVVEGVTVTTAGGRTPDAVSFTLTPGRLTALAGPPGSGKSTVVDVLLGLLPPDEGRVTLVDGTTSVAVTPDDRPHDASPHHESPQREAPHHEPPHHEPPHHDAPGQVDLPTLWRQVTWLPQRPVVEPGTLAQVVGGDDDERARAAVVTGLDDVLATLPDGWSTRVGRGGHGLSVGQAQRVALTRALVRPTALVVLDEPTAHLDVAAESVVLRTLDSLRASGRTVLLVAHRTALLAAADEVVVLPAPRAADSPVGAR